MRPYPDWKVTMTMNDFMEKYLGEVDRRLRRLPVAERVDIVNELKSEIAELAAEGLPPRKYYTITDAGRKYLEAMRGEWKEFSEAIEGLEGDDENE